MATKQNRLIEEIKRCQADPVYFIRRYVKIQHPTRGKLDFKLYPFQEDSLRDFKKHRFNIVLKSRQLGYSTVTAAYCLWASIFFANQAVVVVATNLATARIIFQKVKYGWDHLPAFMKKFVNATYMTKTELTLDNGSSVKAITTGSDAGRGEALSMLIVDEAAFIDGFDELYAQVYPTLSTGGRCVILSTPGPVGNKYHELCMDAKAGKNTFNYIELKWDVHPERDQKWYEATYRDLGHAKFEREYNCSFDGASENYFSPEAINFVRDQVAPPLEKRGETWIWSNPVPSGKYVLSCDVARGDGGDYSTFHVIEATTGDVAVEDRRNDMPIRDYAKMVVEYARLFNNALIAPERNTYGHQLIENIRDCGYTKVYFETLSNFLAAQENDFKPGRAGFYTGAESRDQALSRLADSIEINFLKIKSQRLLEEMRSFIMKESRSGKLRAEAVRGKHDDLIMSLAIGSFVAYQCTYGLHGEQLEYEISGGSSVTAAVAAVVDIRERSALQASQDAGLVRIVRPDIAEEFGSPSRAEKAKGGWGVLAKMRRGS